DPKVFIPTDLHGNPGDVVTVPVKMLVTESGGISVAGTDLAIQFDPTRFSVSNVRLGSLLTTDPDHFDIFSHVDNVARTIQIDAVSVTGNDKTFAFDPLGDLLLADFTILAGAPDGPNQINLRESIGNTSTGLSDSSGNSLVLIPAPTDSPNDP